MTELERMTLDEALVWSECRRIPKKDDGKNVWIRAIALVAKFDGSKSYCIVERMSMDEFRIVKDFGHVASIRTYLSIHPYEFVKARYIKKFDANATKSLKIRYINMYFGTAYDENSLTDEEVEKWLLYVAIDKQKQDKEYGQD